MGDALDRLIQAIRERPVPSLALLFVGLLLGGGVRGLTADEPIASRVSDPVATVQPEQPATPAEPDPKPDDKPTNKPDAGQGTEGAAAAIDDYQDLIGGNASVGAAVVSLDGSDLASGGGLDSGPPWSAMKVPASAAYLNFLRETEGTSSGEAAIPEGSEARTDLGLALVQSDNLGIRRRMQAMIDEVGAPETANRVTEMLLTGGVTATTISPEIDPSIDSIELGTGMWFLDEAAEWFRRLQAGASCLGLAEADRSFILRQLHAAPSALPWGAVSELEAGSIALKPGWGASDVYTTEQMVIVGSGDESQSFPSFEDGYVMAIMAQVPGTSESSFAAGKEHLQEMADLISDSMGDPAAQQTNFSSTC